MKTEISSLELSYLIKELEKLKGSRIEKIYAKDNKDLFIQFYKAELGKPILRVKAPNFLYLTLHKPSFSHPSNFCTALRKRLTNGKLTGISKLGNERIVKLTIDKMDENGLIKKKYLFFELFLKGNVILTDDSMDIDILAEGQIWANRELKAKQKYSVPKKHVYKLKGELDVELVKFLAESMNLGGEFAEEVCHRATIDKKRKVLSDSDVKLVNESIEELKSDSGGMGYVYSIAGKKQIYPFLMKSLVNYDKLDTFSSFNEALDSVLTAQDKLVQDKTLKKEKDKKKNKYEKILDAQQKSLEKNEKLIDDCTKKGDLIYQNFNYIAELLDQLKLARNTMSWKEIKGKLKNHKTIKSIDEKNGKIVLDI